MLIQIQFPQDSQAVIKLCSRHLAHVAVAQLSFAVSRQNCIVAVDSSHSLVALVKEL